jgi:diguanylate cyclase (GGDEF)-like protein
LTANASPRDLILVVDDDEDIARFVQVNLEVEGFGVLVAHEGETAFELAREHRPDLAVVDLMMPGVDGLELTRRMRSDPGTSGVPIIMLTAKGLTVDKVVGLTAGADDYVVKPFDTTELVARIRSTLRRSKEFRELSPLTGLPGNTRILQEVTQRSSRGEPFAVGHVDIDRFKAVNDLYGFGRGDEFIVALAKCLLEAAAAAGDPPTFIGHVGGDDFVIVCTPDQIRPVTESAVNGFNRAADGLYDPESAARGYVELTDRRGDVHRANLVTLSIGVALSTLRPLANAREMVAAASEMKTVAKGQPASYVAVDRRHKGADGHDDETLGLRTWGTSPGTGLADPK